jgi:hypothetical protein
MHFTHKRETTTMATFVLVLSSIAAVVSLAALVGVLAVRRDMKRLRSRQISEPMHYDSRLGVYTSRPEDLQRYRESIAAATLSGATEDLTS